MIKSIFLIAISVGFINSAYALDTAQQTEMVAAHNKLRQTVDAPAIKWSANLATTAQAWADSLKINQNCKPAHSKAAGSGENLFWASAVTQTSTSSTGNKTSSSKSQVVTSTRATDAWGNEVNDYTYSTNTCATGKPCGHYTQVVWKSTTEVGCANAVCADNTQIWVCNYTPPGNYVGQKPY